MNRGGMAELKVRARLAPFRLQRALVASAIAASALLAACAEEGRLLDENGRPVSTQPLFAEGVDGLTVGHRLMAAREYEAALSAYTRAAVTRGLDADSLSAIGSANLKLGRLGQAERYLRQALDRDERFVPAWNNLGVVLYTKEELGEAREAFRVAFALDNGQSEEIRENLRLLDARLANIDVEPVDDADFRLVRRGNGRYLLLGN